MPGTEGRDVCRIEDPGPPGRERKGGEEGRTSQKALRHETVLKAPAKRSAHVRLQPPLPLASRHLQGLKLLEHSFEVLLSLG